MVVENRPLVSCCMIVKNEEKFIKGCIASLIREVDEIVLVDTGSEDSTVEIAKSFGDKVRIFYFEWVNDFAEARNYSLSKARGEWIICLDADERLNTLGAKGVLRHLASSGEAEAYTSMVRNLAFSSGGFFHSSIGYVMRFFKKLPGVRFERAVHEQVFPSLKRLNARIGAAPFIIDHLGYHLDKDDWMSKLQRNLELSKKEVENNPDSAAAHYYLAITYFMLGNTDEAWKAIEKAYRLIKESEGEFIIAGILNLRSRLLLEKKEYLEVVRMADESLSIVPKQSTANLLKSVALYFLKRYEEAVPHAEITYDYHKHMGHIFEHASLLSHEFIMPLLEVKKLLANCYHGAEYYEKALDVIEPEIEEHPKDPELLRFAASCAVELSLWNKAERFLISYAECKKSVVQVLPLLTRIFRVYAENKNLEGIMRILEVVSMSEKWIASLGPFLEIINKTSYEKEIIERCKEGEKLRLLIAFCIKNSNWKDALFYADKLERCSDFEGKKVSLWLRTRFLENNA